MIAREFEHLAVDRSEPRPLIAMVGELYVCQDVFSNNGIIREVENAGGEIMLTTFTDWLYYCDLRRRELSTTAGDYLDVLGAYVQEAVERHWEHKLHEPVAHLLRHPAEIRAAKALPALRAHYDTMLGGEGVMTMARSVSYAGQGVSGVLNILPFSCMLGDDRERNGAATAPRSHGHDPLARRALQWPGDHERPHAARRLHAPGARVPAQPRGSGGRERGVRHSVLSTARVVPSARAASVPVSVTRPLRPSTPP